MGQTATYYARWVTSTGLTGPWSAAGVHDRGGVMRLGRTPAIHPPQSQNLKLETPFWVAEWGDGHYLGWRGKEGRGANLCPSSFA